MWASAPFLLLRLCRCSAEHLGDLALAVGQAQYQVLVFAMLYQIGHQRPYGHLMRPEVPSHEYHRTGVAECEVVVLYGFLEYLL